MIAELILENIRKYLNKSITTDNLLKQRPSSFVCILLTVILEHKMIIRIQFHIFAYKTYLHVIGTGLVRVYHSAGATAHARITRHRRTLRDNGVLVAHGEPLLWAAIRVILRRRKVYERDVDTLSSR